MCTRRNQSALQQVCLNRMSWSFGAVFDSTANDCRGLTTWDWSSRFRTPAFGDQVFKKAIYAQAGIPVYWLVNLLDGRVEEYTAPTGSAENADYGQHRDYLPADEIPLLLDGHHIATIPVRDLLP